MEKKIEVCIGTDRTGNVRARLSLLVVDDGNVISESYHAVNFAPTDDYAAVRAATEAHLGQAHEASGIPGAPWPAIPDEEWAKVTGVCHVIHTPDVIAKTVARNNALVAQAALKVG